MKFWRYALIIFLVAAAASSALFFGRNLNKFLAKGAATSLLAAISGTGSGLIGHWSFDEGTGVTVGDTSGKGNNGQIYDGPTWSPGRIGDGALSFNGVYGGANGVNITDTAEDYNFESNQQFSVFAWVKAPDAPNASRGYDAILSRVGSGYYGWSFGIKGSTYIVGFGSNNGGSLGSLEVTFPRGETNDWHLVGFTYNGNRKASGITAYVDGRSQVNRGQITTSDTLGAGPMKVPAVLQIGTGLSSGYPLKGELDDVRIYDRALSALEIGEIYELGGGVVSADPPTIKNLTPRTFIPGTATAELSIKTTEDATCRYSSVAGVEYGSMPSANTFTGSGGTIHTISVPGLANGNYYTYYVRCQEDMTAGHAVNTTDFPIKIYIRNPLILPDGTDLIDNSDGRTLRDLPGSALWSRRINFAPGDGEEIQVNPPVFTWTYTKSPTDNDYAPATEFWLQIDDSPDFSSLLRSKRTDFNMYTFLSPFEPGKYYWRVGYLEKGGSEITSFGPTRSFTITSNIPRWDLGRLADPAYLAEKSAHPHMLFNAENRDELRDYLENMASTHYIGKENAAYSYHWDVGRGWVNLKQEADASIKMKWWGEEYPEHFLFLSSNFNFSEVRNFLKSGRVVDAFILAKLGIDSSGIDTVSETAIIQAFKKTFEVKDLFKKVDIDSIRDTLPACTPGYYSFCIRHLLERAEGEHADWGPPNDYDLQTLNIGLLKAFYPTSLLDVDKPVDYITRGKSIRTLGFVWQITQDPKYLAVNPGAALVYLSRDFMGAKKWRYDAVITGDFVSYEALSLGYDWFYEQLDQVSGAPSQRAEIRRAIEHFASWNMYAALFEGGIFDAWDLSNPREQREQTARKQWEADPPNYNGPYRVQMGGLLRQGTSHQYDNAHLAFRTLLAMYGELSPQGKKAFELLTHYMIAKGSPFNYGNGAIAQGRSGYGYGNGQGPLTANIYLKSVFPEIAFEKNPYLVNGMDWWSRVWPVAMVENHDAWGDGNYGNGYHLSRNSFGRDGGLFLNDGNIFKHWENESTLINRAADYHPLSDVSLATSFYHQTLPTSPTSKPLSSLLLPDGWVTGCSAPTYSPNCFKNGVGFMFSARPYGQFSHGGFGDLSYQLWAHGTSITDAGGHYKTWIAGTNMGQYTIMVDGLGHAQTNQFSAPLPYLGRIFAYKHGANYTYTAADGTNLYPTTNFQAEYGSDGSPQQWFPLHSGGPLSHLKKVHRHFLFVKNKYFVIFDDLAADKPTRFSSLFPVLEDTIEFTDEENTAFTYTSNVEKYPLRVTGSNFLYYNAPFATTTEGGIDHPKNKEFIDKIFDTMVENGWAKLLGQVSPNPKTYPYGDRSFHILQDPNSFKAELMAAVPMTSGQFDGFLYYSGLYNGAGKTFPPDVKVHVAQLHRPSELRVDDMTGSSEVYKNPFRTTLNFSDPTDPRQRTHTLWYSNASTSETWNFLTVIYPENPADTAAGRSAEITRIDDYTARVENPDGTVDIISFNSDTAVANNATVVVDLYDLEPTEVVDDVSGSSGTCTDDCVPPPTPTPPPTRTLTIQKSGDGEGNIIGAGIACHSTCTYNLPQGTAVSLSASPLDSDSTFTGWNTPLCSGVGTCTFSLTENTTVRAIFTFVGVEDEPPIISSISGASTNPNSATISWSTDLPSSTQVEYGLTTSYGNLSVLSNTPVTSHTVTLTNLIPNTVYHYRVVSTNVGGTARSTDRTFTTPPLPPFVETDRVVITKPIMRKGPNYNNDGQMVIAIPKGTTGTIVSNQPFIPGRKGERGWVVVLDKDAGYIDECTLGGRPEDESTCDGVYAWVTYGSSILDWSGTAPAIKESYLARISNTVTPSPSPSLSPSPSSGVSPSANSAIISLVDGASDKASAGDFAPGANANKMKSFDWHLKGTMTLSSAKTASRMTLRHNLGGEGWSTSNTTVDLGKSLYPLVVFMGGMQKTSAYNQTIALSAGINHVDLYAQMESASFAGGILTVYFTDGTTLSATIASSSIRPGSSPVPPSSPAVTPASSLAPQVINAPSATVGFTSPTPRPTASLAPSSSITQLLSLGSEGSEVTILQNFLKAKGYLTASFDAGMFDRNTRTALQEFQTREGIVSSGDSETTGYGATGPMTRTRINQLLSGTTVISSPTPTP